MDVETIAIALTKTGIEFETSNPLIGLMENPKTGKFRSDILNERVLSTILEFKVPVDNLLDTVDILREIGGKIDTVFSVGIISVTQNDQGRKCQNLVRCHGWKTKANC